MLARGRVPPELLMNRWQIHSVLSHLGLGGGRGCEVGVHRGHHAQHLLEHWPGDLWLVDAWEDRSGGDGDPIEWGGPAGQLAALGECVSRLRPYAARARYLRGFSPGAAGDLPDGFFDFVYIDATHTYAGVKADLAAWRPKVREGGLFCGHDYLDGRIHWMDVGVKAAVDEFALQTGCTVFGGDPPHNWYMLSPGRHDVPMI